jgi:hypothetical protein
MDVGSLFIPGHLTRAGWRRRHWGVAVCCCFELRIVDVIGVPKFDVEVGLPTGVEGGVGEAFGLEFVGDGDAGAIEGEGVMRDGDAVDGHEGDGEKAGEGELGMDAVLVKADEARENDHDQAEGIAIVEEVGGAGVREKEETVGRAEGAGEKGKLTPGGVG